MVLPPLLGSPFFHALFKTISCQQTIIFPFSSNLMHEVTDLFVTHIQFIFYILKVFICFIYIFSNKHFFILTIFIVSIEIITKC